MRGKFFGIGVGPGDPDLITVKAVKLIESVDVLVCPLAAEGRKSFAFEIASPFIPEGKEILEMVFPMVHDQDVLKKAWKENAEIIEKVLDQGKDVAFLTLGDPTVYSTYMYTLPYFSKETEIETVPGITSFCMTASRVNLPLALWEETFAIVPLRKGCVKARAALENNENVVIMKVSHDSKTLGEILIELGLEKNFVLISKCSTEEEKIITDINVLLEEKVPYLSTMIVKKQGIEYLEYANI